MNRIDTNLGDLISTLYTQFLELYEDEELAAVATASLIEEMMASQKVISGAPIDLN